MLTTNTTFEAREELSEISLLLEVLKLSLEGSGHEAHYFMALTIKDRVEKAIADLQKQQARLRSRR